MQEQLEELEYIKNNMTYSSNSSLPSNETEEQAAETLPNTARRHSPDAQRRKRLLFLHEAQRLVEERRTSLAQTPTSEEKVSKRFKPLVPVSFEEEEEEEDDEQTDSFNFDQRSEEDKDTANLQEVSPGECYSPFLISFAICLCRAHHSGPVVSSHHSSSISFEHVLAIYLCQCTRSSDFSHQSSSDIDSTSAGQRDQDNR